MRTRWNSIYRQILDEIEKEVQIHPHYADLQNQFALVLRVKGETEKAETHFLEAIRLNPNYLFARINLGVLYEDQKRWKGARREYRRILQITPDDEHIRKRLERIS